MNRRQFIKSAVIGIGAATVPLVARAKPVEWRPGDGNVQSITWPDNIKWADGVPPLESSPDDQTMIIRRINGEWYGYIVS